MSNMRARSTILSGIILVLVALPAMPAHASETGCEPREGLSSLTLSHEVSGQRDFLETLDDPGWTFNLKRTAFGWDIRLVDEQGVDLGQMTAPLHGPVNPRQIYGWHFRSADNSGPNRGDVNAPQARRVFGFDPALSGTAGYRPNQQGGVDALDQPGCGVLTIEDMGLADLEPGQQARLVYLKFNVFLAWPPTEREIRRNEEAALELAHLRQVTPEMVEMFGSCGLDLGAYEITPYLTPALLSGDFDGDGSLDNAVPISRMMDGKRGIAICRAGTWLHLLGLTDAIGPELVPAYFESMDWWRIDSALDPAQSGLVLPAAQAQSLTIGKGDSSSVGVFWSGEAFSSAWQGD